MGARFWLLLLGGCVAVVMGVALLWFVFGAVWYTWGLGGALFVLFGGMLLVAWIFDRRDKRAYLENEDEDEPADATRRLRVGHP